ncbi:hypothetical protein JTE90_013899 [Oedothorax gibbosus]|uniref:Uncharacterized protein n=1 Tax=Oedothorax gibbosus TaxID=931172 RepID=A0AAV6VFH0_9ARAC|nr:hypothetical protein JTE90_013899 [Oedothorax gibbosus]
MEEEKVEKKKKKSKSKKKKDSPKKPSEKKLLKAKIAELDKELSDVSSILEQYESILESWKSRISTETHVRDSCVAHLRRNLVAVTGEGLRSEEELKDVRRGHEEEDRKWEEVGKRLEAEKEEERSVLNQQKTELKEKLSLLEDRRLKRNFQISRLAKLEESLADKLSKELHEDREENQRQVQELLRKRDAFVKLVDDVVADHEDMFRSQLPVYVREQVEDNVRFRTRCHEEAETLLKAQEKHRCLKSRVQDSLRAEIETQDSADLDLRNRATETSNRLNDVLTGNDGHRPVIREYLQDMRDEIATMTSLMESTQDQIEEVQEVMRDQDHYMKDMEISISKLQDGNGIRASKILRASRVFKARVNEVSQDEIAIMDTSVLQQIKMILEDENGQPDEK